MSKQGVSLANAVPKMRLVCPKCDIVKTDVEEMEIHVKMEHLGWLPFQCPMCPILRASDGQMREHIYSGHSMVNVSQYVYVDNIAAKRELVGLLNQALFRGVREATSKEETEEKIEVNASQEMPLLVKQDSTSADSSPQKDGPPNLMALLGEIGGNNVDMEGEEADDGVDMPPIDIMAMFNAQMVMQNMAALFPASAPDESKTKSSIRNSTSTKGAVPCNACHATISVRSRAPHVYYHLHSDHNEPRFRCRFGACDFAVYRKDVLDLHMTKSHGTNAPEFFEDRVTDINHLFKTVSKELFGQQTAPRLPDDQIEADGGDPTTPVKPLETPAVEDNAVQPVESHPTVVKGKRKAKNEFFKCEKCNNFHKAENRSFHVLFHLYQDNGVVRYACKICGFKHQLQQQITQHATQEHGMGEDVVEDSLNKYTDALDEISMAYFGESYDTLSKKPKKNLKRLATNPEKQGGGGETEDEGSQGDETVHQGRMKQMKLDSESEMDGKEKEPLTDEQKTNMAKALEKTRLSEISRIFGGSHYLAPRPSGQAVTCKVCLACRKNGVVEHAYCHMTHAPFACPLCDFDTSARKHMVGHIKERHAGSDALPVDRRLKYAVELKETMKMCYGDIFIDAPLPTNVDLENFTRGAGELLPADRQDDGDA